MGSKSEPLGSTAASTSTPMPPTTSTLKKSVLDRQQSLNPEALRAMLIACSVFKNYRPAAEKAMALHEKAIEFDTETDSYKVKSMASMKELSRHMVYLYTTNAFYGAVNKVMRDDDGIVIDFTPFITLASFAFRSDLDVLPKFMKGVVYRGLQNLSASEFKHLFELPIGEIIEWPAFTSTSASDSVAKNFSGGTGSLLCHIHIHLEDASSSEVLVPCCVEEISAYKREEEVLGPWGMPLRMVQACEPNIVYLETTHFPGCWDKIEQFDEDGFAKYAEEHPDLVGAQGSRKSIPNAIAESFKSHGKMLAASPRGTPDEVASFDGKVKQFMQTASGMFSAASKSGANLNERAPDGSVALSTVCSLSGHFCEAYQEMLGKLVSDLTSLGASPSVVVWGSTIAEKFPKLMKKASSTLAPGRWEYYVDDGIDGKSLGWYPYAPDASKSVEACFQQWFTSPISKLTTKSGYFTYNVDFEAMRQENTTSHTVRQIRRKTTGEGEAPSKRQQDPECKVS